MSILACTDLASDHGVYCETNDEATHLKKREREKNIGEQHKRGRKGEKREECERK